jgi:hypothetical protein
MAANYLSKIDRAALVLALDMTLKEPDRERVEQVQYMLNKDGWYEAATFCSYHRQTSSLGLRPWEDPPCAIDDPDEVLAGRAESHRKMAASLCKEMMGLGVSVWHPDPRAALEAAGVKGKN